MKNKLNKVLVAYILKYLPTNIKSVVYLKQLLDLSSESVYRRLRGEISFTIEEIVKLSHELGFSIDEAFIHNVSSEQAVFKIRINTLTSPHETFLLLLKEYCWDLTCERNSKKREAIIALNHVILPFTIGFNYLFKFNYYRWIHQTQNVPLSFSLSDVEVPPEILSLCEEAQEIASSISNTTFILDQSVFINSMRDVQHYYQRNLITEDELDLIKKDFESIIDQMESLVQKGCNNRGASHNVYLSLLNVKSNIILCDYDDNLESHLWYHFMTPLSTSNQALCIAHRKWLISLKKYSVLISQSNEILSSQFFNLQRKYINEMHIIS